MPRPELRVFYGPDDRPESLSGQARSGFDHPQRELVEVTLCDIVTVLADAMQTGRVWLQDFGDERVMISRDLFEVLQAYQHLRRSAA